MDFSMSIAEPVDAVVTWVNGNEPVHRAKRLLYSQNAEQNVADFALTDWRFIDAGEVRYSIYSIRKFAPWIRNIYLVTDNQQPAWLTEDLQKRLNVKTIDHTIIFHDHLDCLPTFNNMSIGFLLFRIPGLANRYITFNDDNFIITPVTIDDFFIENKPVIRGKWYPQKKGLVKKMKRFVKHIIFYGPWEKMKISHNHHCTGARFMGFNDFFFETVHSPYSWRVDIQNDFFSKNPALLNENVKYRFRNNDQLGPSVLFTHLVLKSEECILNDGSDTIMIIPQKGGLKNNRKKFDDLKRGSKKFLCFQDMAFLKQENPREFQEVTDYLDKIVLF